MTVGGPLYDEEPKPAPSLPQHAHGLVRVAFGAGRYGAEREWDLPPGARSATVEEVAAREQAERAIREQPDPLRAWLNACPAPGSLAGLLEDATHGDDSILSRIVDRLHRGGFPRLARPWRFEFGRRATGAR